jgi:hypothetical protein
MPFEFLLAAIPTRLLLGYAGSTRGFLEMAMMACF